MASKGVEDREARTNGMAACQEALQVHWPHASRISCISLGMLGQYSSESAGLSPEAIPLISSIQATQHWLAKQLGDNNAILKDDDILLYFKKLRQETKKVKNR